MAALPAILLVASTALQTVSAIREGQVASAQAKAQGATMEANANLATMEAEATKKSGAYEEAQLKRQKLQALSKQQALYAKSGVILSEGSPLSVMGQTALDYEMDLAASRYNTAVQVGQKEYEANYNRTMAGYYSGPLAKSYKTSGYVKAGGTLLSSGYSAMKPTPKG